MVEYIEREAALAAVCQYCSAKEDCLPNERCVDYELVNSIPAADVAPIRHGRWISHGWSTVCSECGEDYAFAKRNYCPNCGALMDMEVDE